MSWNPEWFLEQEWLVAVFKDGEAVWTSEWMNRQLLEKFFLNDGSIRDLQNGDRVVKVFTRKAVEVTSEFQSYLK